MKKQNVVKMCLLFGTIALALILGCTDNANDNSSLKNNGPDSGTLQNGLSVEVEVQTLEDGTLYANEIEIKEGDSDNEDGDNDDGDSDNEDGDNDDGDSDNEDGDNDDGDNEKDDDLFGIISDLTDTTFVINGILITYDENTEIEDGDNEDGDNDGSDEGTDD